MFWRLRVTLDTKKGHTDDDPSPVFTFPSKKLLTFLSFWKKLKKADIYFFSVYAEYAERKEGKNKKMCFAFLSPTWIGWDIDPLIVEYLGLFS